MRRHVASAVMAALLISVLFLPSLFPFIPPPWRWPTLLQWFAGLVSWSGLPAIMILALLGDHSGPDGMPGGVWLVPFAYFLQWWIILDLGLWARYALRQDARAVMKPTRDQQ